MMASPGESSRWERMQELFHLAAEMPPGERARFLAAECADGAMRQEIEELLALDTGEQATVAVRAVEAAAGALANEDEQRWMGRRVGAWRIVGVLGRGGMGAVYEVERADGAYQQRAALKLMRREMGAVDGARRFAEERQILAGLEHANIARLLDGGNTEEGLPYLVLELVEGLPIHRYAQEQGLREAARVRLVATAAMAVQAAHRKLVVHRDLKPANILVGADGTVKLLDFGIAQLVDPSGRVEGMAQEELMFSPAYASPEQKRGEAVTTAADVYALGAVLHEVLTGKKLADGGAELGGDLQAIVNKATAEAPGLRYESAERLAADLEAYLAGRPVEARAGGVAYRAKKFLRRNAVGSVLAALAVAGLIGAAVYSNWQARRADRRFGQVRQLANQFLFEFHDQIRDLQGSTKARESIVVTALGYLESLAKESGEDRDLSLELAAAYDRVGAIQYSGGAASLGRAGEAQKSYEKAIAIRGKWLEREPGNAALHRLQAETYLSLAGAEMGRLGVEVVTEAYTKGLSHGEKARGLENPAKPEVLDTLAKLYKARGLLLSRAGKLAETVENYRAALAIHEQLAAGSADPERAWSAADSRARVALALYFEGKATEAMGEFERAAAGFRALRAAHPENRRYGRSLKSHLLLYGGVLTNDLLASYDPGRAKELFGESLELAVEMAKDEADRSAQLDLAAAHCQYGGALEETDGAGALREYEAGMGLFRRLGAAAGGEKAVTQAEFSHLPSYVTLLARLGKAQGLSEGRRAVEMAAGLAGASPNSMQAERRRLVAALALGEAMQLLGRKGEVAGVLRPVLGVVEKGELAKVSHSQLRERMEVYRVLWMAGGKEWGGKFEECASELERRGLGGRYLQWARGRMGKVTM